MRPTKPLDFALGPEPVERAMSNWRWSRVATLASQQQLQLNGSFGYERPDILPALSFNETYRYLGLELSRCVL